MNKSRQSLLWKLLLPVPLVLLTTMLIAAYFVPDFVANSTRDAAVNEAVQTVSQFKTLRSYYTKHVVRKAISSGALNPGIMHKGIENSIPLPATMIHDMSNLLSEQNINIQLYSMYPFPNRANRKLDKFQKEAWDTFQTDPEAVYSRQIKEKDQEYVRVAIADRMIADACVNCHNTHPDSPKTDWIKGNVRGVLEVRKSIEKQLASGQALSNRILLALFTSGLVIVVALIVLVRRHILHPINSLIKSVNAMAMGDFTTRVTENYDTEVNDLATAFNQMAVDLTQKEQREKNHLEELKKAADIEQEVTNLSRYVEKVAQGDLSERLEISGNKVLEGLGYNLNRMTDSLVVITRDILTVADDINKRVEQVEQALSSQHESARRQADTADRSSSTLNQLVESSKWTVKQVEHLGQSAELTQQHGQAGLTSVQSAITAAEDMRTQIDTVANTIIALNTRTLEIDTITNTVRDLAMQSKFLAFNAAIESAKAGEAGKGFAVVSREVRQLAEQSEKATEEVKTLLDSIESDMRQAVNATKQSDQRAEKSMGLIKQSGGIIEQLTEAIHEAGSTSNQIVNAVHNETQDIYSIRNNISSFQEDTQAMLNAADYALEMSKELRALSKSLNDKVSIYRI